LQHCTFSHSFSAAREHILYLDWRSWTTASKTRSSYVRTRSNASERSWSCHLSVHIQCQSTVMAWPLFFSCIIFFFLFPLFSLPSTYNASEMSQSSHFVFSVPWKSKKSISENIFCSLYTTHNARELSGSGHFSFPFQYTHHVECQSTLVNCHDLATSRWYIECVYVWYIECVLYMVHSMRSLQMRTHFVFCVSE